MSWLDIWMLSTVVLCLLVMLDDVFVDLLALFIKAHPRKITQDEFDRMNGLDQKRVAILIANWQEADVLERMVNGNIQNIDYQNYEILLGVYPNDQKTLQAARRAESTHRNVRVVVNSLKGPTSKGQMINEMVVYAELFNHSAGSRPYDLILTHDAEDVIHKYSLKLINLRSQKYDFIQIPVFSQETDKRKLTAGIYIDEFVDSHTKNLLVRDYYHAGVPSAGVGTAVSRSVVSKLLKLQDGHFLKENTLTEDYFLGLTCYDLDVKAKFVAEYFEYTDIHTGKNVRDYIATREYFPRKIKASVRQKTRWIMGICLQSYEQASRKSKTLFGSYFLWKDRKGLWCAPLFVSALIFTIYFLTVYFTTGTWPSLENSTYNNVFVNMMWANLLLSLARIVQRFVLVSKVYGYKMAALVPVRWVLSNFINNIATFNAVYSWSVAKMKGEIPKWSKTTHIIPVGFGLKKLNFTKDNATTRPVAVALPPMVMVPREKQPEL